MLTGTLALPTHPSHAVAYPFSDPCCLILSLNTHLTPTRRQICLSHLTPPHPYPRHPYPQHHIVSRWPALTTHHSPLTLPRPFIAVLTLSALPRPFCLVSCAVSPHTDHFIFIAHRCPPLRPDNPFDPVLSLLCTFVSTPLYPSLVSPYFAHPRWLCLGSVRRLSYRDHF